MLDIKKVCYFVLVKNISSLELLDKCKIISGNNWIVRWFFTAGIGCKLSERIFPWTREKTLHHQQVRFACLRLSISLHHYIRAVSVSRGCSYFQSTWDTIALYFHVSASCVTIKKVVQGRRRQLRCLKPTENLRYWPVFWTHWLPLTLI